MQSVVVTMVTVGTRRVRLGILEYDGMGRRNGPEIELTLHRKYFLQSVNTGLCYYGAFLPSLN